MNFMARKTGFQTMIPIMLIYNILKMLLLLLIFSIYFIIYYFILRFTLVILLLLYNTQHVIIRNTLNKYYINKIYNCITN